MAPLRNRMIEDLQLRGYSNSTVDLCGIKFFYENTIKLPWPTLLYICPHCGGKLGWVKPLSKLTRAPP